VGLRLTPDQLGVSCDRIDGLIVYVDSFRVLDSNNPAIPSGKFPVGYGYRENSRESKMLDFAPVLANFSQIFSPFPLFSKKRYVVN
jgi:hypothetical protein